MLCFLGFSSKSSYHNKNGIFPLESSPEIILWLHQYLSAYMSLLGSHDGAEDGLYGSLVHLVDTASRLAHDDGSVTVSGIGIVLLTRVPVAEEGRRLPRPLLVLTEDDERRVLVALVDLLQVLRLGAYLAH